MALMTRLRKSFEYRVSGPVGRYSHRASLEWQRFRRRPNRQSRALRHELRTIAGLPARVPADGDTDGLAEFRYLFLNHQKVRPSFEKIAGKRVLFVGQAYYNSWYLSRALRRLGWFADVLNWDTNPSTQLYYHGDDFRFTGDEPHELAQNLGFFLEALYKYDIFHFSNAHGICFGFLLQDEIAKHFGLHAEIHLLRDLGKKIVYTNNGCLDGVSQTSFASWGDVPVCSICRWRNEPSVCSDERNLRWGRFRNSVADFQCLLGGNRADFNTAATVHEVPEFYCLDPEVWRPDLEVPARFRLPPLAACGVRLYHGVGNRDSRTDDDGVNIKCSHIFRPLIDKLRQEGRDLALIEPTGVPNRDVRFLQVQADIFLDMLTYGWFGATAREGLMLGKPVIAYLRPEWLESLRREIPDYADELPIVQATPDTIESVLRDLIDHPEKRRQIGERSRRFAVKWHSGEAGARRFDHIYGRLITGDPLLRDLTHT
jgi:glycosyltransferase involved in cell wall biosynthesis